MKKVSKKTRRRMFLIFALLFLIAAFLVKSVYKDWQVIFKNKKDVKELSEKYDSLLEKEKSLDAEVTKFQDPDYVARYAREKYLYSLPGELIIRVPKSE